MPLIEFKCENGHVTEQLLSRSDADTRNGIWCPKCQLARARRVDFSHTGSPILKRGVGGFHKPSRE